MVNLVLAILSSAMVSLIMRLSKGKTAGNLSMLAVNYVVCLSIAGLYMGFGKLAPALPGLPLTLGMGAANGLLYLAGFVLLQLNVQKNGVVLPATFMKLGLLVPMALSVFLFGELPAPLQIAGFALALCAIVLIHWEKGGEGQGDTPAVFRAGLLLLLLASGAGDAMSKIFQEWGEPALSEQFLFYTFLTALLLCVGWILLKKEKPDGMSLLFGALIGVPNYFSARFLLKALEDLPAVIVYPTYSVATILLLSVAGVCFFHETLKKRQSLALAMILLALVLLQL